MFGMTGKDVTDDLNTAPKSSLGNPVLGSKCEEMQSFQDSDMQVFFIKNHLNLTMLQRMVHLICIVTD